MWTNRTTSRAGETSSFGVGGDEDEQGDEGNHTDSETLSFGVGGGEQDDEDEQGIHTHSDTISFGVGGGEQGDEDEQGNE